MMNINFKPMHPTVRQTLKKSSSLQKSETEGCDKNTFISPLLYFIKKYIFFHY